MMAGKENLLGIFSGRAIADASGIDVGASVGVSGETKDKLTDKGKTVLVAASNSSGDFVIDPGCDQPDSAEEEGSVYVQITILSKKVGIHKDGTILLSSLSCAESLVSLAARFCIDYKLATFVE